MEYKRLQILFLLIFLPCLILTGQDQIEKKITENFIKYCELLPREEIYMHTDRKIYIAGEDLWFDIYLFNRKSNKISDRSKLAYVEVLNSDNHPVLQKRIRLDQGNGPGMISLPDTLSTGVYVLRAYTNWMKNYLPGNCFIQELKIYNAISDRKLAGKSMVNESQIKGTESGYSLDISNSSDIIIISILTNKEFLQGNNNFYVFAQTRGNINFVRPVKLTQVKTILEVDKKLLLPGVNEVTLFDSEGKFLVSENIYTPVNEDNIPFLKCHENFGPRQKIILEIDQPGAESVSGFANLSISVSPISASREPGIADYMVFGSEFGIIPDQIRNHKLSELSPEVINEFLSGVKSNWIDWNRILSGNFETSYLIEDDSHYLSGRLINNDPSIIDSSKNLFLSIPGKNAVFNYARTNTDGKFSFDLPVDEESRDLIIQPENAEGDPVINIESSYAEQYAPLSEIIDTATLEISGAVSEMSVNYQVARIYKSGCSKPSEKSKRMNEVKRFYGKPDLEIILADYLALPTMEEVFFELTPGVFLKNKKSVYRMSVADRVDGRIFDKPPVILIDGIVINDPSIIAALDPDNVERIDAIKDMYIVGNYMFFGIVNVITKAGDFSSVTLPDYAVRLQYTVTEPVRFFCSPDYTSEASKKARIPDFRNTLYWNPSVKPDENGKAVIEFWSSDYSNDYKIDIQGIDSDGKPFSSEKIIKILTGKR